MKLGKFEGTTEELDNICQNHGFDPNVFIDVPSKKNFTLFLSILLTIFTIICICLWTFDIQPYLQKPMIIIGLLIVIITTAKIHIQYERMVITTIALTGGVLLLMLSLGYITPKEALNDIRKNIIKPEAK